MALTDKLTNIAEAIRTKTGKTDLLTLDQMPTEIENIQTGGGEPVYITNGDRLFYEGVRLDIIDGLIAMCKNMTSARYMFYGVNTTALDISKLDTSSVTNMTNMFDYCRYLTELDLSNFDTKNVTNMGNMFNSCQRMTQVNVSSFDTSNVTNMDRIFNYCQKLAELDLRNFDTSKVTSIYSAFSGCDYLESLNLSSFDLSSVDNNSGMLYNSKKLANLNSFKNLGKGFTKAKANYSNYVLDVSKSPLTYESLIDLITNGLYDLNLAYDVANGGTLYTQQLILGSTNTAKLTADEIAVATNKGWTVS